jgi:cell division septal protein FtsQ
MSCQSDVGLTLQMKKPPQQSITSLPPSPDEERRTRVMKYSIAMSVRLLCVVLCFFVHGWLLLLAVIAALVLPYVAVVVANTASTSGSGTVLRPGSILRFQRPPTQGDDE